jgi:hypothetical protein
MEPNFADNLDKAKQAFFQKNTVLEGEIRRVE